MEVSWIYQFAYVLQRLNVNHVGWIDALSWLMVAQVVISQGCVWGAILTGRLALYLYEEAGWGVIFVANTVASAFLYATVDSLGGREILLQLNLLFGVVYLPWQLIHLRALRIDANTAAAHTRYFSLGPPGLDRLRALARIPVGHRTSSPSLNHLQSAISCAA